VSRRGEYDNPEQRPLSERCLLGFGSTSGPPALPDYFYNDMHQIVQTSDSILIVTEMIHDARIVRMNGQHLPKNMRRWLGDSVGPWVGDRLVVDLAGHQPAYAGICLPRRQLRARRCDEGRAQARG
jgi:hypothetical protein